MFEQRENWREKSNGKVGTSLVDDSVVARWRLPERNCMGKKVQSHGINRRYPCWPFVVVTTFRDKSTENRRTMWNVGYLLGKFVSRVLSKTKEAKSCPLFCHRSAVLLFLLFPFLPSWNFLNKDWYPPLFFLVLGVPSVCASNRIF